MTSNVKLLPLPEPALEWPTGVWLSNGSRVLPGSYFTAEQVRANVEANTEALWAEVRDVVNAALDKVIEFRAARHEAEARAERLAEAINAVLADMSEWGEPAKSAHILRVINSLSIALHPTAAQEEGK